MRRAFLVLLFPILLGAAAPPVEFVAAGPEHEAGAAEYARIWRSEGARIVAALEAATGQAFPPEPIEVIVSASRPMTSYDGRQIRLRAGYSPTYKKATLVHELGHRLAFTLPRSGELDDHRLLYLFLYDVWADLYGEPFATRMVQIERRIPGPYDYDAAWTWALGQSRDERQSRLRALRGGATAVTAVTATGHPTR